MKFKNYSRRLNEGESSAFKKRITELVNYLRDYYPDPKEPLDRILSIIYSYGPFTKNVEREVKKDLVFFFNGDDDLEDLAIELAKVIYTEQELQKDVYVSSYA